MNETEKRRQELLNQTRRRYGNSNTVPAVHPRYRASYTRIYKEEEVQKESGFGFRLLLAVLCFFFFAALDQSKEKVATVDSSRIVNEIQEDIDLEKELKDITLKSE